MTKLLIRLFIRNPDHPQDPAARAAYGLLAGWVAVALNLLLGGGKLLLGLLTHSIALSADAANNLSDVGTAAVTILGFLMMKKPPDREHPFGHGRAEYIAALGSAFLILMLGLELLSTSIARIIAPEAIAFSWVSIAALALAILLKLWLGRFTSAIGRIIASPAMAAAALDSRSDAIATGAVLFSTLLAPVVPFPLDGIMGAVAAGFVLVGGVQVLRDTVSALLGEANPALLKELRERLLAYPGIRGVHDLRVHQYGATRVLATAHAEVDPAGDLREIHDVIDRAEQEIGAALGLELTIHMDPV